MCEKFMLDKKRPYKGFCAIAAENTARSQFTAVFDDLRRA